MTFRPTRFTIFENDVPHGEGFVTFGEAHVALMAVMRNHRAEGRRAFGGKKPRFDVEGIGIVEVRRTGTLFEQGTYS